MSLYEPSPWSGRALAVLRIVTGILFITFGTMKLFGWPTPMPPGQEITLMSQMGIGSVMEVVGGALIVLGLFTRPTAFILAGEMAVAYFQFHAPQAFWPIANGGVSAVVYCFLFLYLAFAGAGEWSVDAAIARSRRNARGVGVAA
jgi:putative oxidoreductase